ncbi:efflux RND transporter permease subunit [bacterium]|nr:efflux RND transporter permease subunit [candidate division CSSED10-310 bacterium]
MFVAELMLRFKTTIYVLVLGLIIVGLGSYTRLPLESAPEIEIPYILVHTIYPGVSPEDIERLITNVIERELKDLKDVKEITSSSLESFSSITLEFETGIDTDDAYQKVRDKVDKAKPDLPDDAEDPGIIEINTTDFPIMQIIISGAYGLDRLKSVAESLEDRIEQVPGVLGVDLVGGLDREIYVYLDPERLEFYRIGVEQVINRIRQEHRTTPAGNLELGGSKYSVRIPGEYKDVSLMEDIVVKAPQGKPIKIRDIGYVVDGFKDRETVSRLNGTECVSLRVRKQSGENIVRIAEDIKELLITATPHLPSGTNLRIVQDSSEMIKDQVDNVENSIISGLIMVLLVLWLSLGLRNASFVAFAIPLSMLITFIWLEIIGVTLNFVVLFSLILALGMLVDNSIVVIENIYRHASMKKSIRTAAIDATREVSWPIITSTATTVAAFFPLLYMPGIPGEFMVFLPITVITALLATLFVALVVNPVIAGDFLKPSEQKLFDDHGTADTRLMKFYRTILTWSLDHPILLVSISIAVLIVTFGLYRQLSAGVEFFPESEPLRAEVIFEGPQGLAIDRTDSVIQEIESVCMKEDNAESTIGNSGFSPEGGLMGGSSGTNAGVVDLEFKDRNTRSQSTWNTITSIRDNITNIVGGTIKVKLEEKGPPTGDPISIEISGPDYSVVNEYAQKVIPLVASIEGAIEIETDFDGSKPEIQIDIDREKAMRRKVNSSAIAMAVSTAINGTTASVLREGDEEYDIVVKYDQPFRQSIRDILDIRVTGVDDVQIPLGDVATVTTAGGLGSIKHIDGKRSVKVSGQVSGRSSTEIMADAERLVREKIQLPDGYEFHFSGENEMQEEMAAFLKKAFGIGILLIFLILITQFNSLTRPFIILASVVMSLNGVLLGLMITQSKFSIMMTGMGIISLAGVVVNNAIVLIDYIDRMKATGLPVKDALIRAGMVRLRPVMLTAITTILGMVPMAIGVSIDFKNMRLDIGSEDSQWWGPMAHAVIFGLLFATLLTLILVPVLYYLQETMKEKLRRKFSAKTTALIAMIVLISCTLCATPGLAADVTMPDSPFPDSGTIPTITLDEAMTMALVHNPSLQVMKERIMQADYLINKAWAILLPNLDMNASYTHYDKAVSMQFPAEGGETMSIEIQSLESRHAGLNASIAVFNARAYPLLKYAYENRDQADMTASHVSNELLVSVVGAYYQIESAKNAVLVAQDALANADEFYKLSLGLLNVGNATRIDLLRAESEVLDAQNQLDTARDAVELSRTALAALINWTGKFDIKTPQKYEPVSTDLDTLFEMGWQKRRDLDAARHQIRMAERLRQDVIAQWFPSFDLKYGWQWNSNAGYSSDNDSWNVELSARWSILDGGVRKADLQQKESDIRIAQSNMKDLELRIQQEIESNLLELKKRERSIALISKQLKAVEETHRLIKRQFEVGMATSLDLQTAVKDLTAIRQRLVIEELNYALAALQLNKSAGEYLL